MFMNRKKLTNTRRLILMLALLSGLGGCAGNQPESSTQSTSKPASGIESQKTMPASTASDSSAGQCHDWKYPELSGTTNNWVKDGCAKCAASVPNQSPIVLDPTTANGRSAFALPTNLSDYSYTVSLVRRDDHNNYAFAVSRSGDRPLTVMSSNWGRPMTLKLEEFHFHVPAEHVVVGQPVSMLEMHVKAPVIGSVPQLTAVFAIQFAIGPETGAPYNVLQPVAESMAGKSLAQVKPFELGSLIVPFLTQSQFQYYGSLTTPTCDAPVFFFVLREPVRINSADWKSIANSLTALNGVSNARPIQARPLTMPSSVAIVGR